MEVKFEAVGDGIYKTWFNPIENKQQCDKLTLEEVVAEIEMLEMKLNSAIANLTTARQQVEVLDAFKNGVETAVDIMKRVSY